MAHSRTQTFELSVAFQSSATFESWGPKINTRSICILLRLVDRSIFLRSIYLNDYWSKLAALSPTSLPFDLGIAHLSGQ